MTMVIARRGLLAAGLFGFLVWGVVAVVAVVAPGRLPTVVPPIGVRADTLGAVGYLLSSLLLPAVGAIVWRQRGARRGVRSMLGSGAVLAGGGWVYILSNGVAHPETLDLRLTHFAQHPLEREFGIACFVLFLLCIGGLLMTGMASE